MSGVPDHVDSSKKIYTCILCMCVCMCVFACTHVRVEGWVDIWYACMHLHEVTKV